jgi:DNA-binding transcriptional LysR family regulator
MSCSAHRCESGQRTDKMTTIQMREPVCLCHVRCLASSRVFIPITTRCAQNGIAVHNNLVNSAFGFFEWCIMADRLLPTALHYVDHVARCGSIQAAAKELSISASAIDRQILLLEAELAIALFERRPRGMRLTAAGNAVVSMARRWRGEVRRLGTEIRQLEGINHGHLRVVAMDSLVNGVLLRIIERLRQEHPLITIEIEITTTDQAMTALVAGEADVGLVFNLTPHREIRVVWTSELPLGCVVAPDHEIAGETHVSLQRAASFPVVLQGRSLMIRRYLENRLGWLFQKGQLPVTTNSLQLVKQLARSGAFVALTSELDAAPELLDGSLAFVPVRDRAAEPQTISVASSARIPLPRIGQVLSGIMAEEVSLTLAAVRKMNV